MVDCRWGVPRLAGVSRPEDEALIKGGRSGGGVGRGLLLAKFRNERPSRELDEFRDDVRVAIYTCERHETQWKHGRRRLTKLRRLAAPQRFSISLQ